MITQVAMTISPSRSFVSMSAYRIPPLVERQSQHTSAP
jgi:hypothetical protein